MSGILRGMAYADYHVLVATLAPIFWLAGLVGTYRAGALDTMLMPWAAGSVLVLVATLPLAINVGLSLDVLGGWGQSTEGIRGGQAGLLAFQVLVGFVGFVLESARRDRRD